MISTAAQTPNDIAQALRLGRNGLAQGIGNDACLRAINNRMKDPGEQRSPGFRMAIPGHFSLTLRARA